MTLWKTLAICAAAALLLSGCIAISPPYGCPLNCDDWGNHSFNGDLTTQVHPLL